MRRLTFIPIAILLTACGKKAETSTPQKRDLVEIVYASGNLYPMSEYKVFSNVTGYLEVRYIQEGDSVNLNQPLFSISGPNRESETEATRFALQLAKQNSRKSSPVLAQLRERQNASRLKANNDSLTFIRCKNLAGTGAVAQADFDRVKTQYEVSKSELTAVNEQLASQGNSLKLNEVQAKNRYNQAINNFGEGILRSALKGQVYEVYKEVGDFVHQNEPLALVGTTGPPIARLSIDESDLLLVKRGQSVLISLDAYPDKTFKATVSRIYPKLNKIEQSFRVDAEFNETPPEGIYGLNLEANIVVREVKNAITIPRSALLNGDSVMVKRNGNKQKVKVQRGVSDLNYVEIIKGLETTDEVISTGQL